MKEVIIYTDGSARGNPGPGGYGAVLLSGTHKKELKAGFKKTTNNRMELLAAIVAIESLNQACKVTVFTDSKYVSNAMTEGWIHGWRQKGWSRGPNKPLKNKDLWQRLYDAIVIHKMEWKWVKGHAGNPNNERCDYLATFAAQSPNRVEDTGFIQQLEDEENGLL